MIPSGKSRNPQLLFREFDDFMCDFNSRTERITPDLDRLLQSDHGFAENNRRGTGHFFSSQALDLFLKSNGLSYVIRAHEMKQAGFQVRLTFGKLTIVAVRRGVQFFFSICLRSRKKPLISCGPIL